MVRFGRIATVVMVFAEIGPVRCGGCCGRFARFAERRNFGCRFGKLTKIGGRAREPVHDDVTTRGFVDTASTTTTIATG
uniref:Putative secreted protein n=1 Tax=Anopheles darlingi TaxID=43151 RepID=A0A2M4DE77_ANODA